ncbi:MAG: GNAT family N-acetyltransferase [Haloarculaceae archaeon]
MTVREATIDDATAIRAIARRSMAASYSLSPKTIEGAVEQWYDDDAIATMLDDDEHVVLVADSDGEVAGFAESVIEDGEADLLWLHVSPEHRGHGVGESLFDATRETLDDRGIDVVRGRVLADNAEGNDFYERQGFEKVGESDVDIDGSTYVENVYVEEVPELEPIAADDRDLFVDHADHERGSEGPFAVVYADSNRERRYGYYCTNCGSLVTTMDAMGRMECPDCGNRRKPMRWDAAYL